MSKNETKRNDIKKNKPKPTQPQKRWWTYNKENNYSMCLFNLVCILLYS